MGAAPDSDGDIKNPDAVEEMYEAKKEKEREEIQDAEEALTTEQWLEEELDKRTKPVEIWEREFSFQPFGNETTEHIISLFNKEAEKVDEFEGRDISDIDPEELQGKGSDMPHTIRAIRGELIDHFKGETDRSARQMKAQGYERIREQDGEKLLSGLPFDVLLMKSEALMSQEELTEEEAKRAKNFR